MRFIFSPEGMQERIHTEALSASNLVWTICTTEMTLQQPTEGSELLHLVLHQPSEEQLCEVSLQQHEVQAAATAGARASPSSEATLKQPY